MSDNDKQILALAQTIYLTQNGVYNDVTGTDQTNFINMTIDWVNQFLDELSLEADWSWVRTNDDTLGVVSSANQSFDLNDNVQRLATNWQRDVKLTQTNGQVVTFRIVNPNQLSNPSLQSNPNRCAVIGRTVKFSRPFADIEIGGTLTADTIGYFPALSHNDISVLSLVDPKQLIVLGTAKNMVLPDVVNNTLTPAYNQKYNDILKQAIANDGQSSELDDTYADDLSYIRGVF